MKLVLIFRGLAIIFGLGLFVMIHEFGHLIAAKISNIKVTDYFIGFGPKIFSFKRGETTYGVAAIPLGGYVKISGNPLIDEEDDEDDERGLKDATFLKKVFVVITGPLLNIVIALLILTVVFDFFGEPTNVVEKTIKSKPAYGLVKPNDKIISINDKKVNNWLDLHKEIEKYPSKKITLSIIRKGDYKKINIKTTAQNKKGFLGIAPKFKKIGVIAGAKKSSRYIIFTIKTTNKLIIQALSGKPQELIKNSATPVGIVAIGAKFSRTLLDYLFIIGVISLALGYFNLLPIPPLDGGHLVVYIIEKIKGSPIRKKLLIAINIAGLALILTFFVALIFKEITKGFPSV